MNTGNYKFVYFDIIWFMGEGRIYDIFLGRGVPIICIRILNFDTFLIIQMNYNYEYYELYK